MGDELGLHHTTISKALRGSSQISEKTRLLVSELAKKRRYHPNQFAKSLRSNSTTTLGVIIPYVTPPYYATLLDALNTAARQRGLHLEVHFHQWNCHQELEAVRELLERRVMGLLICPAGSSSLRMLNEVLDPEDGIPVVLLTSSFSGTKLPPFVTARVAPDRRKGALVLGQHLLERGHRHMALLVPTSYGEDIESNASLVGMREALAEVSGTSLSLVTVPVESAGTLESDGPAQQGGDAGKSLAIAGILAARFLELTPRPTVAVTIDEPTLHVLLAQLHAAKVRVPEEVSVACFGGTYLSEFGILPLTCVKQAFKPMAEAALEVVSSKDGRKNRRWMVKLIESVLVTGESVTRLPIKSSRKKQLKNR